MDAIFEKYLSLLPPSLLVLVGVIFLGLVLMAWLRRKSARDLVRGRLFWAWFLLCLLGYAIWHWSARTKPFPLNSQGILVTPFASDRPGELRDGVEAVLDRHFPGQQRQRLSATQPISTSGLGALAKRYNAALVVGGTRISEGRFSLALARPDEPTHTFFQALSEDELIARRVEAVMRTPLPGSWSALLLTAENFTAPDVPPRPGANAAGAAVKAALMRLGVNKDRIRHLADVKFADLDKELQRMPVSAPDQQLLCYFRGHVLTKNGSSYFCPADLDDQQPERTGWEVQAFIARLGRLPGKVLLVLDEALDPPAGVPKNLSLLVAGQAGQPLYSSGELDFSSLLVQGLDPPADDDGAITLHEWFGRLDPLAQLPQKPWCSEANRYLFHLSQGDKP